MEIKKQTLTSASHSEFTLETLKQIAPSAFTEVRGADGELTQKVNFDVLRELLGVMSMRRTLAFNGWASRRQSEQQRSLHARPYAPLWRTV
ncbi:hypothetical protein MSHRCOH1_04280 [Candidatus Ornithobacterium hominis]|nr:hypothetical protein MSHRCOH1_04280 [Candidatus Ornithobacterium hominis]